MNPRWLLAAPILVAIDLPYLYLGFSIHRRILQQMTQNSPLRSFHWFAAICLYFLMAIAIGALASHPVSSDAILRGAILGAAMYGTYDLTLLSVLGPTLYPPWYALIDILWGIFVISATTFLWSKWFL